MKQLVLATAQKSKQIFELSFTSLQTTVFLNLLDSTGKSILTINKNVCLQHYSNYSRVFVIADKM